MISPVIPNLRDIPNLDDRLIRYLEGMSHALNQLLSISQGISDKSDANINPTFAKIRSELESTGTSPLNLTGLLPTGTLASDMSKDTSSAPYANDAFIIVTDQQGNSVKIMTTT